MFDLFVEFNPDANVQDYSCENLQLSGCTDSAAMNYSEFASVDDGSCIEIIEGCMHPNYLEYNANANVNDNSCATYINYGSIIVLELRHFTLHFKIRLIDLE